MSPCRRFAVVDCDERLLSFGTRAATIERVVDHLEPVSASARYYTECLLVFGDCRFRPAAQNVRSDPSKQVNEEELQTKSGG